MANTNASKGSNTGVVYGVRVGCNLLFNNINTLLIDYIMIFKKIHFVSPVYPEVNHFHKRAIAILNILPQ